MKIKLIILSLVLMVNLYSQEQISEYNLSNYVKLLEDKRLNLVNKLPKQYEWETDNDYYLRKNELIMNDKKTREYIEEYIKYSYLYYKNSFFLSTSNRSIVNSSFDREAKTWSIQFDLKTIIFPEILSVYYPILWSANIPEDYTRIKEYINNNESDLKIECSLAQRQMYEIILWLESKDYKENDISLDKIYDDLQYGIIHSGSEWWSDTKSICEPIFQFLFYYCEFDDYYYLRIKNIHLYGKDNLYISSNYLISAFDAKNMTQFYLKAENR